MDEEARVAKLEEKIASTEEDSEESRRARTTDSDDPRLEMLEGNMRIMEGLVGEAQEELKNTGKRRRTFHAQAHIRVQGHTEYRTTNQR